MRASLVAAVDFYDCGFEPVNVCTENPPEWRVKAGPLGDAIVRRTPISATISDQALFKERQSPQHDESPMIRFISGKRQAFHLDSQCTALLFINNALHMTVKGMKRLLQKTKGSARSEGGCEAPARGGGSGAARRGRRAEWLNKRDSDFQDSAIEVYK